jgi:hypothetical protein
MSTNFAIWGGGEFPNFCYHNKNWKKKKKGNPLDPRQGIYHFIYLFIFISILKSVQVMVQISVGDRNN